MPAVLRIKNEKGEAIAIPAIRGDTGPQGPVGPKGDQGIQGEQGLPGKDGITASELAQTAGFNSVADFYEALSKLQIGGSEVVGSSIHIGAERPPEDSEYECWIDTSSSPAKLKYLDKDKLWQVISGGGGGGGGGGTSTSASNLIESTYTDWGDLSKAKVIAYGNKCIMNLTWDSRFPSGNPTGKADITLYKVVSKNKEFLETYYELPSTRSIDFTNYLVLGSNDFYLKIEDATGEVWETPITIETRSFSIEKILAPIYTSDETFQFVYRVEGSGTKNVRVLLKNDVGEVQGTYTISTADMNYQDEGCSFNVSSLPHGRYVIEAQFTCQLGDSPDDYVESNILYHEFAHIEKGNTNPIILTNWNTESMYQYDKKMIQVRVISPNEEGGIREGTREVYVYENTTGTLSNTDDCKMILYNRNTEPTEYEFKAKSIQENYIFFKCGDIVTRLQVCVNENENTISAVTGGLKLHLNAVNRSNTGNESIDSKWEYVDNTNPDKPVTISGTLTGFNFTKESDNDGWVSNGDTTILRLKGEAKAFIPIKIFDDNINSTGKTIELEFKTSDVLDYDAEIIKCYYNKVGFIVTAKKATLYSQDTSISVDYKENDLVRISFVMERVPDDGSNSVRPPLIMVYINGVQSRIAFHPSQGLSQGEEKGDEKFGISIGNPMCTTDIYSIRVYNGELNRKQIVDNWLADTQDREELNRRYKQNNIYDNNGNIDKDLVLSNLHLPCLILHATDDEILGSSLPRLPQSKGDDEREFMGEFIDPLDPSRSFTFSKAYMNVQGTSSQDYFRKNYDIGFYNGIIQNGITCYTFKMSKNSFPTNFFCLKADVASSEGANNVELVQLFEDFCPVKIPPQLSNASVRQGIEGFPIAIFLYDKKEYVFFGKYNFNNSKSTPEVFGMTGDVESWSGEFNGSGYAVYRDIDFERLDTDKKGRLVPAWSLAFDPRYIKDENEDKYYDDGVNLEDKPLFAMIKWVNSTCRDDATNNFLDRNGNFIDEEGEGITLPYKVTKDKKGKIYVLNENTLYKRDTPEYRLAKFKNEVSEYFDVAHLQYFWLFTEFFVMMDNREKNTFPTRYCNKEGKWLWYILPYDFDTAIGINNKGAFTMEYSVEDTDTEEVLDESTNTYKTTYRFNGGDSVLFCNVRDAFRDEIQAMYHSLRNNGFTYNNVVTRFDNHQEKWGESIFNEDSLHKCIRPLEVGDERFVSMLNGDKEPQRESWLTDRFSYMDGRFNYTNAENIILFRPTMVPYLVDGEGTRVKDEEGNDAVRPITITPYRDMYASIFYSKKYRSTERAWKGVPCDLEFLERNPTDSVSNIESASDIAEIDGLQYCLVDYCNISYATKLQNIIIGNANMDGALTDFSCGNNYLLTKIDLRRCKKLSNQLHIEGCSNIKEVYLQETNISDCRLPIGGYCETLYLPESITTLTLINHRIKELDFTPTNLQNLHLGFTTDPNDIMKKTINVRSLVTALINNVKNSEEKYSAGLRLNNFVIGSTDENDPNSFEKMEEVLQFYRDIQENCVHLSAPKVNSKNGTYVVDTKSGEPLDLTGDIYIKQDKVDGSVLSSCLAIFPEDKIRLHYNRIEATVNFCVDYYKDEDKNIERRIISTQSGSCVKNDNDRLSFDNPALNDGELLTKYLNGDKEDTEKRYVFVGWDIETESGDIIRYDNTSEWNKLGVQMNSDKVHGVSKNMTFVAHFREDTMYYRSFVDSYGNVDGSIQLLPSPAPIKVNSRDTNVYYALDGEDNVIEPSINPNTPRHKNVLRNGNLCNLYLNGWIDRSNQGSVRYADKENNRYVVPNISEGDSTDVVYITSYEAKRLYSVYFHAIDPASLSYTVIDQVNYESSKPISSTTNNVSSYYDTDNIYNFSHWNYENDSPVDFNNLTMGTSDIHLYAAYTSDTIEYTVRFIVDGKVIQTEHDKTYSTLYDIEYYSGPTVWERTSPNKKTMRLQRWVVRNRLVNDTFYLDYIAHLSVEEFASLSVRSYFDAWDGNPEGEPEYICDKNSSSRYSLNRFVARSTQGFLLNSPHVTLNADFTSITRNTTFTKVSIETIIGRQGYIEYGITSLSNTRYPCNFWSDTQGVFNEYYTDSEGVTRMRTNSTTLSSIKHDNEVYNTTEEEKAVEVVPRKYDCPQSVISWLNQNVSEFNLPSSDINMKRFIVKCSGHCVYVYETYVIGYYETEVDIYPEYN